MSEPTSELWSHPDASLFRPQAITGKAVKSSTRGITSLA